MNRGYMVARKRAKVKRKKAAIKKTRSAKPAKKKATKKKAAKKKASKKVAKKKVAKVAIRKVAKAAKKKKKSSGSNTSIRARKKKAAKKAVSSRHVRAAKKRWRDHRKREKQIADNVKAAVGRQLAAHPELAGIVDDFKKRLDAETKKAFKAGIRKGRKETIEKERAKFSAAYIKAREELEAARSEYMHLLGDYIETDESKIMARLILANDWGELDQEAELIAEEYDWDIREVYDLFFETP